MVRICIQNFEGLLNGSNLHLNASNPFRKVQNWILKLRIPIEWFEFGVESFESLWND